MSQQIKTKSCNNSLISGIYSYFKVALSSAKVLKPRSWEKSPSDATILGATLALSLVGGFGTLAGGAVIYTLSRLCEKEEGGDTEVNRTAQKTSSARQRVGLGDGATRKKKAQVPQSKKEGRPEQGHPKEAERAVSCGEEPKFSAKKSVEEAEMQQGEAQPFAAIEKEGEPVSKPLVLGRFVPPFGEKGFRENSQRPEVILVSPADVNYQESYLVKEGIAQTKDGRHIFQQRKESAEEACREMLRLDGRPDPGAVRVDFSPKNAEEVDGALEKGSILVQIRHPQLNQHCVIVDRCVNDTASDYITFRDPHHGLSFVTSREEFIRLVKGPQSGIQSASQSGPAASPSLPAPPVRTPTPPFSLLPPPPAPTPNLQQAVSEWMASVSKPLLPPQQNSPRSGMTCSSLFASASPLQQKSAGKKPALKDASSSAPFPPPKQTAPNPVTENPVYRFFLDSPIQISKSQEWLTVTDLLEKNRTELAKFMPIGHKIFFPTPDPKGELLQEFQKNAVLQAHYKKCFSSIIQKLYGFNLEQPTQLPSGTNWREHLDYISQILRSLQTLGMKKECAQLWKCLREAYKGNHKHIESNLYLEWQGIAQSSKSANVGKDDDDSKEGIPPPSSSAPPRTVTKPSAVVKLGSSSRSKGFLKPLPAPKYPPRPANVQGPVYQALPVGAPPGIEHAHNTCFLASILQALILPNPILRRQLPLTINRKVDFISRLLQRQPKHEALNGKESEWKEAIVAYRSAQLINPEERAQREAKIRSFFKNQEERFLRQLLALLELEYVIKVCEAQAADRTQAVPWEVVRILRRSLHLLNPDQFGFYDTREKDASEAFIAFADVILEKTEYAQSLLTIRTVQLPQGHSPGIDSGLTERPDNSSMADVAAAPEPNWGRLELQVYPGQSVKQHVERYFFQVQPQDESPTYQLRGPDGITKPCRLKLQGIRHQLQKPPPFLVLHLKRFQVVEEMDGTGRKVYRTRKIYDPIQAESQFTLGRQFFQQDEQGTYALVGVVYHSGSIGGGHYTAAVTQQNQHYHCDDIRSDFVLPCDQAVVTDHANHGYLLFYRRVEEAEPPAEIIVN